MCSDHFGTWDMEKVHAFFGAKQNYRSTCAKFIILEPLLEGEMSKKCMPLWRESHFKLKMCKAQQSWTIFEVDVEKVKLVVAQSAFEVKHATNLGGSELLWTFWRRFCGRCRGLCTVSKTCVFCSKFNYNHHRTTFHSVPLHHIALQPQLHLHYATVTTATVPTTTVLHYTRSYTPRGYTILQLQPHYNYNYTKWHKVYYCTPR